MVLLNAFSIGMLPQEGATVKVSPVDLDDAKKLTIDGFTSAIGHQSTADVISSLLGVDVKVNRIAVSLQKGDKALVFQLLTRLEEGKVLSEEEILALPTKWYLVEIL